MVKLSQFYDVFVLQMLLLSSLEFYFVWSPKWDKFGVSLSVWHDTISTKIEILVSVCFDSHVIVTQRTAVKSGKNLNTVQIEFPFIYTNDKINNKAHCTNDAFTHTLSGPQWSILSHGLCHINQFRGFS